MANDIINAYGTRDVPLLPSAPRTAADNTKEVEHVADDGCTGVVVILDHTAFVTAASVTLNVYGVDRQSSKTWLIATTGALTPAAPATYALKIHPNNPTAAMSAVTNGVAAQSAQGQIPAIVRYEVTHGNGNSQTYQLGAHYTD